MPVAVVTGASRGLGEMVARDLARSGLDLVLVGRDAAALADVKASLRAGSRADVVVEDMARPGAASRVAAAASAFGDVDVLINNAAVQGPAGMAWVLDQDQVRQTLEVDLMAPMALCAELAQGMVNRGRGWIVNVSGGGATGPRPLVSPYAVAKTGLVRYSEILAAEGRRFGLRVNAIAPGAFASGMTRSLLDNPAMQNAEEITSVRRVVVADDRSSAERAAKLINYLVLGSGRDVTGKLISAVWDDWERMHESWSELAQSDLYTLRRQVAADTR